jgi:hypothetical protein
MSFLVSIYLDNISIPSFLLGKESRNERTTERVSEGGNLVSSAKFLLIFEVWLPETSCLGGDGNSTGKQTGSL